MRKVVLLLLLFLPTLAFAQITEQDQRTLSRIKSELGLSQKQNLSLDSLYAKKQTEIDALDKQIKILQQSAEDGATLSTKVSVLQQKKKDIKNMREIELELILSAAQRLVYQEKIKPQKPQVLHYGMNHDRASCNVCK